MTAEARERRALTDVLRDHRDRLLADPRITAVAEGERNGRPCVLVVVEQVTGEVRDSLPDDLEGYPVVVEGGGPFEAVPAPRRPATP